MAHILVTAGDGDIGIVPLSAHDGLDAVGDQVPGLQAVAHATCPHGDGVADSDRVESEADEACLGDALLDGLREGHQVHVTRVALVPHRRDSDLRLRQIVLRESHAVEDRLRPALGFRLRYARAVLVQLRCFRRRSGCGGGGADGGDGGSAGGGGGEGGAWREDGRAWC